VLVARAECTYALQLGAIATTRHALKLRASHCSGAGGREREEEENAGAESEPRRLYATRGRVLGRVARNSFSLVRPPPPSPSSLPSRSSDGESSRSLGETNSCSRFDMSLALPARFGPSFAHSAIYPRLLLFPFLSSSSFFAFSSSADPD